MDLKVAFRSLWKSPGFSVIAVVVLALGIGANTAIFSVINAVLLRPLPYSDPDQIVAVQTFYPHRGAFGTVSAPDFRDWQDQSHSFSAMSMYADGTTNVVANGVAERVTVARVTQGFFDVFQTRPMLGRMFTAAEHERGAAPAAVIGYSLWQRDFKGDPAVVGKTVKTLDHLYTIVGVTPHGVQYPEDSELWVAYEPMSDGTEDRSGHNFEVIGRLKREVTLEQAQGEMSGVAARLAQQYPADKSKAIALARMQDRLVRNIRTTLFLLMGAVALVLIIACGNVANLLLARVTQRRSEMAIRAALGASRGHIISQLTGESLVLAIPAAIAGLVLGSWGAAVISRMAASSMPDFAKIGLDWRVALFAVAAALGSTVLFGVTPAWHAAKVDLNDALRSGGSHTVVRGGSNTLRAAIVVGEITISMVLLLGATLLFRSLMALANTDPGFRVEGVEVMDSTVPASDIAGARAAVAFYKNLLSNVATTPGVKEVAATSMLPNLRGSSGRYTVEGRPAPAPGDFVAQQAGFMLASPGYFKLLRIPQIAGRDLSADSADAPLTCVINAALAHESFAGEDPIGKRIKTGYDGTDFMTIVGVVGDVRQYGLDAKPGPIVYMPYEQHPRPATRMKLLFRTEGDPAAVIPTVRAAATRLNPEIPVRFLPLSAAVETSLAPPRFRTLLLSLFAGLAVLLAVVGLYGVMAFAVAQRAKEIGLRMALGASTGQVLRMIVRQGMKLILPGIAMGAAIAIVSGKLLASFVYGVKPSDPLTFVLVAAGLVTVSLLAMIVPARRASRIDPLIALRQE